MRPAVQWLIWRRLALAQAREHTAQVLLTGLAIALGVALGYAVYLVNRVSLDEFDQATRRLVGEADVIIRGPPTGFSETLFPQLLRAPAVEAASPVLEIQVAVPNHDRPLRLLGLDPFRAAELQPTLMAQIGANVTQLFERDSIILSAAAAQELGLRSRGHLVVTVGGAQETLRVIAVLPSGLYPEPLGLMDLASAQWVFKDLGRLNRIDLRLRPGTDAPAYRSLLASQLPAGVLAVSPQIETERAASATRAYRVNLNMLALVALLTGAFLVFSTQWLSVLRRRHELALLRAVGVTRAQLQQALIAEGAALGAAGSLLGLGLGFVGAHWVLRYLAVDLTGERLFLPLPALAFFALGAAVACLGAWLPAREAARRSPALALKSGDAEAVLARSPTIPGIVFLCAGGLLAVLPATHGLPLAGYASVASLLLGSVLLAPMLMRALLRRVPRSGRPGIDVAMAQLRGSAGLSAISLAAVIVSFSLMVAMSIMVYSFRDSFEVWLERVLPADIQLRTQLGSTTVTFSPEDQRELATIGGVARATFQRSQPVYLSAKLAPVTLIARDDLGASNTLPLVSRLPSQPIDVPIAWVSESFEDIYASTAGSWITVPLDGRPYRFLVAGVWRDYVRPGGAIVIERPRYIAITGDRAATEGALWLYKGASEAAVNRTIHNRLQGRAVEIISTPELRIRSLAIFDRAFAMTYALEMIAVVIGLVGVGVAASTTALSRRAQFGVLRHLGMLRRQVLVMLASEGLVMSGLGVAYGLALGVLLSLVLIYVINRQSFNWSIDLSLPWLQLGAMSLALIAASALTSMCSGRAAMSMDVIRAAREDW